jgi:hypothetical protein
MGNPFPAETLCTKILTCWPRVLVILFLAALQLNTARAKGVLTNGWTTGGTISPGGGDSDYWTFSATNGDSIVVGMGETVAGSSLYPYLRLYGPDGAQLDFNYGQSATEVSARATSSGTFTVVAANNDNYVNGGNGAYQITLGKTGSPIVVASGKQGGPMANGFTYQGTLLAGDLNVWSFPANSGDSIVVAMGETVAGSSLFPSLRLYGPDGAQLDFNYGQSATEVSARATNSGTFTVVAANNDNYVNGGNGTYWLRLTGATAGSVSISNLRVLQRPGTALVDLSYDLSGSDAAYSVSVAVSSDGGTAFTVPATHFTGDGVTSPTAPGTSRHILWDAGADLGPGYFPNTVVRVSFGASSATSSVFPVNLRGVGGGLTVSGQVLDGATGASLAGATAHLGSNSATSDAQGRFAFSSVSVGDYTLSVSEYGYTTASVPMSVVPGNSPSRVVTLFPVSSPSSAPRVTSVTSKYTGFRYFLDGVPFGVEFRATVDWAAHPPGTVQFITPHKTYTAVASGSLVSQTLAMGADFGPNGRLRVAAVSSDGIKSSAKQAQLVVMPNPFPGPLGLLWSVEDDGDDFNYNQTTASPQPFIDNIGVEPGVIPSDIPLVGGKEMNLGFLPEVTYKASSSDGLMQISMAWSDLDAGSLLDEKWKDGNITELTDCLTKFIDASTISAMEVPKAGFGDLSLSLYPVLGGGWKYDSNAGQWKWWDAELGVAGNFSIQQTWPFAGALFAKVKFDLSSQVTAQLQNTAPVSLNGEFNLDPSLRGSLGAGISEIASAEVWVEGGMRLDLQYPATPTVKDASVYVEAGTTVYLLLFPREWTLLLKSWDIYGVPQLLPQALVMQPISDFPPLGRGYLNYPASGVMGRRLVKPMLFGSSGGGVNPEVLMSPAFPFSDPNCSSSGTNCCLVFLEDNTNRTSLNRTMAMFSRYDGTMWALPVPLGDDGTADFHPRILTFADGSAVAAWENEGTAQPTNAALSDMVSNLEVSVAWYSPAAQAWLPAQRMTTNYFLDRSPKLAGRTPDNVLLTWVSNPANDTDGSPSAPNQIWSARWNGTQWGSPQVVATVPNALVKYDLLYDGTNANLVLSVDTVGNSTNANGHELFRIVGQGGTWGPLTQLTSDQTPDDGPQMAFDPQGNVVLMWLKGAELSSVLNFSMTNRQVAWTNEYSSNLADFKLASSGDGKLAVLWSEPSENDADLRMMLYDPIFRAWGAPKQLTHDSQAERNTTAVFYGTNEVIAVYDRSLVSSTNSADTTLSDLAAYYCTFSEDLALNTNLFYCEPANPSPGGLATFHAEALNLGDQFETNVVVAFYQDVVQAASEIGRMTLTNAIPPQGTNDFTFTWAVPATNAPVTIFAVIDPDQRVLDVSRSNNVARLDIVKPDAGIQSMSWSSVASNLVAVTIHVANDGAIGTGGFTVSLNRDSATGTNLFSQAIAGLLPGESTDVTFLWNVSGLPDNLNVYATLNGPGIAGNFSTRGLTSALTINQVLPPSFGACRYLPDGTFQMEVFGEVGRDYALQVSTNLVNWAPVGTFSCTNSPTIVFDSASGAVQFYRIAQ